MRCTRASIGTRRPDPSTAAELLALHHRVSLGDRTAAEQLSDRLVLLLCSRLARAFPSTGDDIVNEAAEDAVLEYLVKPSRFDEARGIPLDSYLFQASWRNLANLIRAETRRHAREALYAAGVAMSTQGDFTEDRLLPTVRARVLESAVDGAERAALGLFFAGEDGTESLAHALEVASLADDDRRTEVKRFKDRVRRRIVRAIAKAVKMRPATAVSPPTGT